MYALAKHGIVSDIPYVLIEVTLHVNIFFLMTADSRNVPAFVLLGRIPLFKQSAWMPAITNILFPQVCCCIDYSVRMYRDDIQL